MPLKMKRELNPDPSIDFLVVELERDVFGHSQIIEVLRLPMHDVGAIPDAEAHRLLADKLVFELGRGR